MTKTPNRQTEKPAAADSNRPPAGPAAKENGFTRRRFLEASGYAWFLAALAGCERSPVRLAPALPEGIEGRVPGRATFYATVCHACSAGCGVIVKNRDGRPIKLEGNPDHPLSQGGLCAVGQAWLLELYDSHRLRGPLRDGQPLQWDQVDREIGEALRRLQSGKGRVRFLTGTVISPTRRALIREFVSRFPDGRHIVYDALSCSSILEAHQRTHGAALLPKYRLDQADVVVSFDADFLGTWIAPTQYTQAYQTKRAPAGSPPRMSYHVQFESRLSLTGCNADRRLAVRPEQLKSIMSHLAARLAVRAGRKLAGMEQLSEPPVDAAWLDQLAEHLWQNRGKSLVLCGSQDVQAQVLCNVLNELLDAYGRTVDLERPSYQRQGRDEELGRLLEELQRGQVDALFLADVNPVAELPFGDELAEAIRRVPLVVAVSDLLDETAELARFVCPEGHPLETWSDAEPVAGVVSVSQPVLRPLRQTRSLLESLSVWLGRPQSDFQAVRQHWQKAIHPRAEKPIPFEEFWKRTLRDGVAHVRPEPVSVKPFDFSVVRLVDVPSASKGFTLVGYPKVGQRDGRHAHNPWLQELPDPVTKVAWDNYACLAPETAARLDVETGDVVRLEVSDEAEEPGAVELPVVVQPGQHPEVVAVALGYGRKTSERFSRIGPRWLEGRSTVGPNGRVGVNVAPLLPRQTPLQYTRDNVAVRPTRRRFPLASTQHHHRIEVPERLRTPGVEVRPVVQETTLAEFQQNPQAGAPPSSHHSTAELWADDHPYRGHHWGMVIDLNKCTGCSACVIACQAENNVPVVGKDEVRRNREMHWLRIDRYYSGQGQTLSVAFQPMMCQQCDHAPCETVCPVLATVHSEEGLNEQVYNRCVGTRYCANNCPYKVRRFNWFQYAHDDALQNAALNPDVTVRSRGVMEKCTFCVQRILEAKLEAKRQGRPLADGEIQPACQQSCPARAIVFGDTNDPNSEVARRMKDPRAYRVLEELNVRPSVTYLRLVRNGESQEKAETHV